MDLNIDLLKRIAETPGISGREDAVRAIVIEEMRPLVDDVSVDALGNVIGRRGSGSPRVMLAAHMDEIGFIVRSVDEHGAIWLQPLGGFDARNLIAQRVFVHAREGKLRGALNAKRGASSSRNLNDIKPDRVSDLFVDVGLSPEETRNAVEIGDMVTMDRTLEIVGHTLMSKSLDDRVSVFVMLELLRMLGEHQCEVVAVATVQEEVGLRGAGTAAFGVEPDIGIAIDICPAGALGDDRVDEITHLGG
ncbi:MAG: M42 family peptidase, partial [Nitrolancea sp.]